MKKKTIFVIVIVDLVLISLVGCWWLMTRTCDGQRLAFAHSKSPVPECLLTPAQGWEVITSGKKN